MQVHNKHDNNAMLSINLNKVRHIAELKKDAELQNAE